MKALRKFSWLEVAAVFAIGVCGGFQAAPYFDQPEQAPPLTREEAARILGMVGWREVHINTVAQSRTHEDSAPVAAIKGFGTRDAWPTNFEEIFAWDQENGWFHLAIANEGGEIKAKISTAHGSHFLDRVPAR